MGYYHSASGFIDFKDGVSKEKINYFRDECPILYCATIYSHCRNSTGEVTDTVMGDWGNSNLALDLSMYEKYHEDDYYDTFKIIEPYVIDGSIYCTGEDGEMWRFIFDGEKFVEENGVVYYTSEVARDGRIRDALVKFIQDAAESVSDGYASELCEKYGLKKTDMEWLGLEYLTDLRKV